MTNPWTKPDFTKDKETFELSMDIYELIHTRGDSLGAACYALMLVLVGIISTMGKNPETLLAAVLREMVSIFEKGNNGEQRSQ